MLSTYVWENDVTVVVMYITHRLRRNSADTSASDTAGRRSNGTTRLNDFRKSHDRIYFPLYFFNASGHRRPWQVFDIDDVTLVGALELARMLQKKRLFTDLGGFSLRCDVCKAGLKGQKEAQAHAQATGHTSFVEYS
ncbi:MAG: hypothetical protein BJ554DRAFT_644 [Olpidium bornovanus]|uniref:OTU1-like C-terminal C2H2-type zinc finger domain-containing protein n=1 Tax=Olpidium bornovanus TaxID=278681 RepID=A0A8H8A165_9FUNG|nr:MAG: hypothetical protein BJ554DRAFT_644 [Olpidium bornovanus]